MRLLAAQDAGQVGRRAQVDLDVLRGEPDALREELALVGAAASPPAEPEAVVRLVDQGGRQAFVCHGAGHAPGERLRPWQLAVLREVRVAGQREVGAGGAVVPAPGGRARVVDQRDETGLVDQGDLDHLSLLSSSICQYWTGELGARGPSRSPSRDVQGGPWRFGRRQRLSVMPSRRTDPGPVGL